MTQYKLSEQRGEPVGRVELFKETHANKSGQLVNQATEDVDVRLPAIVVYFLV